MLLDFLIKHYFSHCILHEKYTRNNFTSEKRNANTITECQDFTVKYLIQPYFNANFAGMPNEETK